MSDVPNAVVPDAGMTPLKRAFLALENTRARLAAAEAAAREPIAIIGLGCRVPGGGNDAQSFWALMRDGVDAIGPLPADRWNVEATYDPDPDAVGRIATHGGGFLSDVRGFDQALFGITRREAQGMDPQQRLLLEVAWEALENAGQAPDRLEHTPTGVYLGMAGCDYAFLQLQTRDPQLLDAHFASGMAHSVASGRLSYLLGLQGPAVTIDTACSSSLVAVHLACQALRAGDCRMALAAGVNLILGPDLYIALSHARMLAPDGRCKTFDATADGFARGEGCGVLVLKRLSQAQADGDRVLAVIRGSAVNQDGPSSGLTAPNGPAQEAVIREALARAGVVPRQVGYVEAHGTGTQLGDPLEVTALGAVFGADRDPARPLLIGSVKTNVGHLEAAAGVTGLIKLVLSLQQRALPPHLHFRNPSPHIAWEDWPVRVPTELTQWEPIDGRRIAGVSSFGFSGTNVHVVVEEAPVAPGQVSDADAAVKDAGAQLFVLSARDGTALAAHARRLARAIAAAPEVQLADWCFSASQRAHLPQRAAIVASSVAELCQGLDAIIEGCEHHAVRRGRVSRRDPARVAFLFTGQGSQYIGMAAQLDATQPVFRAAFDRCAAVLDGLLGRSLRALLNPAPGDVSLLDETAMTQPALFAVEYALASLWQSWGVRPDMLMGHSVGELVAACLAGVLPLEDALALVAERGRLMQSLPAGGAMAAVFAAEADVQSVLSTQGGIVAVAGQNGPLQTVISGAEAAIDAASAAFTARGVRCQRLPVSHAFHSPLVDPVLDRFEATVAALRLAPPNLRLISNLTGTVADAREIVQPRYWRRHLREAVRFADGARTLAGLRPDVCLEIGPQPTLLAFAQASFEALVDTPVPSWVASLRKGRDDTEVLQEALAELFLAGVEVDWRAVWAAVPHRLVDLPGYPFQREPIWFPQRVGAIAASEGGHPLLGARVRTALRDVSVFESTLQADAVPYIEEHRVQGQAILPATGYIEMALAAGRALFGKAPVVTDLVLLEPLRFEADMPRYVQFIAKRRGERAAHFEVLSTPASNADALWTRHAEGQLDASASATIGADVEPVAAVRARCEGAHIDADAHRAALRARGLVFGPSLHGVQSIARGQNEALGEIDLPGPALAGRGDYVLHPALLDACLQVMNAAVPAIAGNRPFLPLAIESITFVRPPRGRLWSHASVRGGQADTLHGEVTVHDAAGPLVKLRGITLRAVPKPAAETPFYEIAWVPMAEIGAGAGAKAAEWMPAPATLAASAGPLFPSLAAEHGLDSYQTAFVALERLSTQWVLQALAVLGWQPKAGERLERAALARYLGIVPRYEPLLGRMLDMLAEDGVLLRADGDWQVVREPLTGARFDAATELQRLRERHPDSLARIELAGRCGPVLSEILRGKLDPLQQLFPDGSTALAEALYRDSPEARACNQLVREAVSAAVAALPAGRRLRVLEVGGGTGGTTAWVAPALPAARCDYLFTDVGPSMVMKAREKFADFGFISCQTLDLEQPVAAQGINGMQFDLILAANVVHATADLRRTLGQLHDLLVPGGMLLMLEVAGLERWIDITFGLTDGWWRFTDTDLRHDYPLLDRAAWLALLSGCGFEPAAIGAHDSRTRELLLAARRPVVATALTHRPWLVVPDRSGLAEAVVARLRATGATALLCPFDESADHAALRAFVAGHAHGSAGVLHLAASDLDDPTLDVPVDLLGVLRPGLGSLLATVQALGSCSFEAGAVPRLVVATRGAVLANVASLPGLHAVQATLLGLGKVIALEHPELRCLRLDLDPQAVVAAQAEALVEALDRDDGEDQRAWRAGAWLVARLQRLHSPTVLPAAQRLEKGTGGSFDGLVLRPASRRAPGPGEVEIRMYAAGLNFRDVMNALSMRDDPEPLGGECAGRIVAVGEGVRNLAVGDDVVAIAEASFATYTTTTTTLVRRLPPRLSFAAAATLPFAFMTAWHALHSLGGLQRGERVLVHAGAGGVGMAAIQIAQAAGAVVYATAGSEAKRALLRKLGVEAVFDSRSLAFTDQVLQASGGGGVDLVLNSLAGDFIAASVRCLAPAGRFLEIGKRDIWTPERFARERPLGRYHAIDLAALRILDPAATAVLFHRVMQATEDGTFQPLPQQAFPLTRAADAFRFMAMARHVGKVVLTQTDPEAGVLAQLEPNATYLVTGGLAGLGLLTAQRLAECGARHLLLAGRRAPDLAALQAIERLRASGAEVTVAQADVSQPDAVRQLVAGVPVAHPLRGVVHSAGLLEDGVLLQQDWTRFVRPLGPKVVGAWALHEATRDLRLDFFVLFSSMAAVLGSAGQGNHAAANAYMDALAMHRQSIGLAGLSIGWGAWSEIGEAAERSVDLRVAEQGIDPITPARGAEWLQALMCRDVAHAAVFPVRWADFLAATPPRAFLAAISAETGASQSSAKHVTSAALADDMSSAGQSDFIARLREASASRRQAMLMSFVGDHVARVIGAPGGETIDSRQPLNEMGLDSLMAVELRNRLGSGLGLARSLPATLVFDHPTVVALADYLWREIDPAGETGATRMPAEADTVGVIDDLSDEEVEQLFAKKLTRSL